MNQSAVGPPELSSSVWRPDQFIVRLALIGPVEAQAMIAALRQVIAAVLARPCPERPHAFVPAAEIAVMRHETGDARLFAN